MRKDKHRDIARGVLPSTARKGARDNKRNFHAKHRHAQRQANHAIERTMATVSDHGTVVHDPDLFDDFEDLDTFDGYAASTVVPSIGWDGMDEIIGMRRGADKLGPLIHWAEAIERREMDGWDDADKIAYFKAVLPDSLQGRHALGHVKQALRLEDDEFRRHYTPVEPVTVEEFRAALSKALATPKSRLRLREFLYETVPVAAHRTQTNNMTRIETVPAVDENGKRRFRTFIDNCGVTRTAAVMVDVRVPQMVAVTCDDCAFLRNDPLATTEAVNRFVDLVWGSKPAMNFTYWAERHRNYGQHPFLKDIRDHILEQR